MKKVTRPVSDPTPARAGLQNKSVTAAYPKLESSRNRRGRMIPSAGEQGNGQREGPLDAEQILSGLIALKNGNFDFRLPVALTGISGKVADTFNQLAEMMAQSTDELSRISRVVGKEGRIQERLSSGRVTGVWSEQVNSANTLIDCLAHPVNETARVIGAVAKGDLSQHMALEMDGRKLEGEATKLT